MNSLIELRNIDRQRTLAFLYIYHPRKGINNFLLGKKEGVGRVNYNYNKNKGRRKQGIMLV